MAKEAKESTAEKSEKSEDCKKDGNKDDQNAT
jgi:hypothetical protein